MKYLIGTMKKVAGTLAVVVIMTVVLCAGVAPGNNGADTYTDIVTESAS